MGRITITELRNGVDTLTTATCPNCNGYGVVASHDEDACTVCNPTPRNYANTVYSVTVELMDGTSITFDAHALQDAIDTLKIEERMDMVRNVASLTLNVRNYK
jgi:DnaJ-class molecular chaperone